ncbi:ABC transporter permease [Psittacicella gerlachiana]|uniref:Transport permease protein n=1 Tax=Psittacicella gerlachiana TaxID=2028574 RepID=A0A3A1YPH7_9GAMM|nr:ABC transporter permease [Psittacicella gerlachiana]RIY38860.1 hypothetical protein CKF59_00220 [Psittacicella gerlachiana]
MNLFSHFSQHHLRELEQLKQSNYLEMSKLRTPRQINLHSIVAIIIQEVTRNLGEWIENLINPIINSFLYLIVFGILLGSILGEFSGYSYATYILAGFLIMNIINTSYDEGSYFIMLHKYSNTLRDFQVAPLNIHAILFGVILASFIRVTLVSIGIYLLCSSLIGFTPITHWSVVLSIYALTVIIFTLLGLINGVLSNSWEQLTFALTFIITPLMYISGIFYDLNEAPRGLQLLGYFNPLTYIVDSFRFGMLNLRSLEIPLYLYYLVLGVVTLLLYLVTCYTFKQKLNIR